MKLLVECKADQLFLEILLSEKEGIRLKHGRNKSEIIKFLTKSRFQSSIGMVDEDPNRDQPSYLELHYKLYKKTDTLIVHRNIENRTSLIVLRPRLEEFVINACKVAKIPLKNYGLPEDGKRLHSIINLQLKNFRKLLEDLKTNKTAYFEELLNTFNTELGWIGESN